ncbi:hypothetical protein BH23GEM9_BH23GEM9_20420 [soil metagenome]
MNRRVRSLVALLALIGFAAFFAESLVAMSCMPADRVEREAAGQEAAVSPMHDGMHHPVPTSSDSGSDTGTPQHCPLAMTSSSCAAPATLPVAMSVAHAPVPASEPSMIDFADVAHELIVRTLFHPPRS